MNVTLESELSKVVLLDFSTTPQKRTGARLVNLFEPVGEVAVTYRDPGPLILEGFLSEAEQAEILDNLE